MVVDLELCYSPARVLARRIASRALSPRELVANVIERARQVQHACNFLAFDNFEAAMAAALEAEQAVMRGDPLGPLHGIPITVKDNLPTVGHPMTNGSLSAMDHRPAVDAIVWQRLRAAGAILIGKTTTPEFAHKVLTDSLAFGVTRSPWSPAHTPGGSSGGASAAVAAGVGPITVGTDGGGSIRCPASCGGLFGLKATLGRIPFEIIPDSFANYAFSGPITRDVVDLDQMLAVMSGATPLDAHSIGVPDYAHDASAIGPNVRGLRIGWLPVFGGGEVDDEVARACSRTVQLLAAGGAHVESLNIPEFADVFDYYVVIATAAHAARLSAAADRFGDRITESMRASIAQGKTWSAVQWQLASDRRTALFRRVQALFEQFDLIATPTLTAPPKPVDAGGAINTAMYADWCRSLYPFNLTGHPAASIPCGFSEQGLPMGLQLIAPWYEERRIVRAAAFVEQAQPWATRRPDL
jgi:aspartyl-tRNA(Asn)/glutamyl-tRNA(Gln) amidotransferase subunit A